MFKKLLISFVLVAVVTSLTFANVLTEIRIAGDFGAAFRFGNVGASNNYNDFLYNANLDSNDVDKNDDPVFKQHFPIKPSKELTGGDFINFGLDLFYEYRLNKESRIGLKVGYTHYPKDIVEATFFQSGYVPYNDGFPEEDDINYHVMPVRYMVKSETYAIPLTVYYKYKINQTWSVFGGIGVTLIKSDWTEKSYELDGEPSITRTETGDPENPYDYDYTPATYIEENESYTFTQGMFTINYGLEAALTRYISLVFDMGYQFDREMKAHETSIKKNYAGVTGNVSLKFYIL